MENNKPVKNNSLGSVLGRITADVTVTCIFLCVVSTIVALTFKFIMWLI